MSDAPTDSYQAGVNNAKGTWELVKDFVTFVSPSVASAAGKRKAVQSLNDRIGEWAEEAKDKDGRWQQPILTRNALEAHLLLEKGTVQPGGECKASFAWAKLLYALNIRPGKKTLEWRTSSPENDPATTGTISLAIEGEALCDIINLYQRYIASSIGRKNEYRFSFGILERKDESRFVTFEGFSSGALKSVHRPFQFDFQDEDGRHEGNLKIQEGTVIESYRNALDIGGSDRAIRLENGKKPLQDRARSLLHALELLDEGDWERPYLVTPTWIEEANSIMRRVTTNGGKDKLLVDHICKCISERPEITSVLKMRLPRQDIWEEDLRETVEEFCMFDAHSFSFIWSIDALRRSEKKVNKGTVQQQLQMAVAQLSGQPEGSWTHDLSQILTVDEIVRILNLPHELVNKPVIVLRQVPKDWAFIAEIPG
ncbi:hypothetical protein EG329_005197 [Mollisiaceae sp. DMI_Dod_QoI]|nr:hypothetical protein EG329_005197 [Helotiales sp. DMI_Dod_QoI]